MARGKRFVNGIVLTRHNELMFKRKLVRSWGKVLTDPVEIYSPNGLESPLNEKLYKYPILAKGGGRSYGDQGLSQNLIDMKRFDLIEKFDLKTGIITCGAGISIGNLLRIVVPKGWFIYVTPGTQFVTVGGAIASDVHGKNHHKEGSFCDYVLEITLQTSKYELIKCSPTKNSKIFHSTCGGSGLTGFIISAKLKLKKIETAFISSTSYRVKNLEEMFELLEKNKEKTYSVAWLDTIAAKKNMGRGILFIGEHAKKAQFNEKEKNDLLKIPITKQFRFPFQLPSFILGKFTIRNFNRFIFFKHFKKRKSEMVNYEKYFYPLDSILEWNKAYGKHGLIQYQLVIPKKNAKMGIKSILEKMNEINLASFLTVLKSMGTENENLLSFPMEGLTLNLDFPRTKKNELKIRELDKLILKFGGRLYLAKDGDMTSDFFDETYPKLKQFKKILKKLDPNSKVNSFQARRLKIK